MSTRSPAPQAGLGEQGVVGGGEGLGEPAGLVAGDAVGHRQRGALGHHHQLGLATAPGDGHDPVAGPEARTCAGPDRHHGPANSMPGMSAGAPGVPGRDRVAASGRPR